MPRSECQQIIIQEAPSHFLQPAPPHLDIKFGTICLFFPPLIVNDKEYKFLLEYHVEYINISIQVVSLHNSPTTVELQWLEHLWDHEN